MISDARLISNFKACLNCHKSQAANRPFGKLLVRTNQRRLLIHESPALLDNSDNEFVSLSLAH
jgi:hypothetical protein